MKTTMCVIFLLVLGLNPLNALAKPPAQYCTGYQDAYEFTIKKYTDGKVSVRPKCRPSWRAKTRITPKDEYQRGYLYGKDDATSYISARNNNTRNSTCSTEYGRINYYCMNG